MKLQQLRYLVAVASEGSIRAAARALCLTQATVTQGLRELEGHAQVQLFQRHSSGVLLTAAGQELLNHAQRALSQIRQAEEAVARHRDGASPQRLSVGVTPWVAQTLIARVLPRFRAELPHMQLELFDGLSALAYPRLRAGTLDFMIGRIASAALMDGLHAQPLFSYEMTVVARTGHPAATARSISELTDHDWVLNFTPGEAASFMHNLFGQHGVAAPSQRIHLAHSAMLMLTLVRQAGMLTFCPWPLVETSSMREGMVALPLRERFDTHEVGVVRRSNEPLSHAAQRFVALFMAEVRACVASDDPELKRVFYSVELMGEARAADDEPGPTAGLERRSDRSPHVV